MGLYQSIKFLDEKLLVALNICKKRLRVIDDCIDKEVSGRNGRRWSGRR